jgi:hypothetical protein
MNKRNLNAVHAEDQKEQTLPRRFLFAFFAELTLWPLRETCLLQMLNTLLRYTSYCTK